MVISRADKQCFFASFLTLLLATWGLFFVNSYIVWIAIIALFASLIWYASKAVDTSIVFGGFLISFFTFLLGKYVFQMFGDFNPMFEDKIFIKESMAVYISLLSLFYGYIFFKKKRKITQSVIGDVRLEKYLNSVKVVAKYSKLLFILSVVCSIMVNIDIASRSFGLFYRAHDIQSRFPFIFQKIAQMNVMLYWIFLSTLPDKKRIRYPTILFIANSILTLSTGARGNMAKNVMAVALYYYFRHKNSDGLNDNSIWITKQMKIFSVVVIPLVIIFFFIFAEIRLGNEVRLDNIFVMMRGFFEQQGGSVDVIGRALYCQERRILPKDNISYTFGPIITLAKTSIFSKVLGFYSAHADHSDKLVAEATVGNNLGATVTYLMDESYYLAGGGFGTCYIAELIVDFGYIGIIIFHLLLAWIFSNIDYFMSKKWWINAIGLLIIRCLLFMPRDFALTFIPYLLSATNIFAILLIMTINDFIRKNHSMREILCE